MIINTIRKKLGPIFVTIIGILIVAMLGQSVPQSLTFLLNPTQNRVGKIGGKAISYTEYKRIINQIQNRQGKQSNNYAIQQQAWQYLLETIPYNEECRLANISVGQYELIDMVQGDHIHTEIKRIPLFQDKKTDVFDKKILIEYLQALAQAPQAHSHKMNWYHFEQDLAMARCRQKLVALIKQSNFKTKLEKTQTAQLDHKTANIKYLYIPYTAIADGTIPITDKELQDYLNGHKDDYQVRQSKTIKYINFPIQPTVEDKQRIHEEIKKLVDRFTTAKDGVVFAQSHTDGDTLSVTDEYTADTLPPILEAKRGNLKKGMVIGPIVDGEAYKLYRVNDIQQQATKSNYSIITLEKKIVASDATHDDITKKIDDCIGQVNSLKTLEKYGEQTGLLIQEASLEEKNHSFNQYKNGEQVVKWLYSNKTKKGSVSPIFELDQNYMIAVMTQEEKGGTAPLDRVRDQILPIICKQAKKEQILKRLTEIKKDKQSLTSIATAYGKGASIYTEKGITFKESNLKVVGKATEAIGTAFGLEKNQLSQPIFVDNGVLLLKVTEQNNKEINHEKDKELTERLKQIDNIMQPYYIQKCLEEVGGVIDNRHKF